MSKGGTRLPLTNFQAETKAWGDTAVLKEEPLTDPTSFPEQKFVPPSFRCIKGRGSKIGCCR